MEDNEFYSFDLYFQYQIKTFMYGGIEATMKQEASHLCALALSTYTEVLGGLVTGNLKALGYERKNYEAFLPYLGEPYVKLDNDLKLRHYVDNNGRVRKLSLYSIARSKLVHEFSPRQGYIIRINNELTSKPGLECSFGNSLPIDYKYKHHQGEHHPAHSLLTINIGEYYRDFRKAVDRYYIDLKAEMKKDPFERPLFNNFHDATVVKFGEDGILGGY